jgi:hypothetical protein
VGVCGECGGGGGLCVCLGRPESENLDLSAHND